jgi:hypothetical protein
MLDRIEKIVNKFNLINAWPSVEEARKNCDALLADFVVLADRSHSHERSKAMRAHVNSMAELYGRSERFSRLFVVLFAALGLVAASMVGVLTAQGAWLVSVLDIGLLCYSVVNMFIIYFAMKRAERCRKLYELVRAWSVAFPTHGPPGGPNWSDARCD